MQYDNEEHSGAPSEYEYISSAVDAIMDESKHAIVDLIKKVRHVDEEYWKRQLNALVEAQTVPDIFPAQQRQKRSRHIAAQAPALSIDIDRTVARTVPELDMLLKELTLARLKNAELQDCFLCQHCSKRRSFYFNPRQWRADGRPTHIQVMKVFEAATKRIGEKGVLESADPLAGFFLCGTCIQVGRCAKADHVENAQICYRETKKI